MSYSYTTDLAAIRAVVHRYAIQAGLAEAREKGTSIIPHGIGLSLGGAEPVDRNRLAALARVVERVHAPMVSEHAAFVRAGGASL